ncbi:hypothetical protein D3C78_1214000 [compost metagenome]
MRDYIVGGGTGRILIAPIAFLVWLCAVLQHNVLEYALNLVGGNTRFDKRGDCTMTFSHHLACLADSLNFMLAF